jgi:hypothetical protein
MLQLKEMDDRVPLADQISQADGPVILINTFQVAPEDADALLEAWQADAAYLKQQPGAGWPRPTGKLCLPNRRRNRPQQCCFSAVPESSSTTPNDSSTCPTYTHRRHQTGGRAGRTRPRHRGPRDHGSRY